MWVMAAVPLVSTWVFGLLIGVLVSAPRPGQRPPEEAEQLGSRRVPCPLSRALKRCEGGQSHLRGFY